MKVIYQLNQFFKLFVQHFLSLHPGVQTGTGDAVPRGTYSLYWPIRGGSARKGYLFQASGIYERVGILLVEVYERVGKSVTWVCEGSKEPTDEFCGFIKPRKRSTFVIDSYLNYSAFTAVKRDAKF